MRLSEITIDEFKNLHNVHVEFDIGSPYTVLVGENGAGKSNFVEALTLVFRNLDLELRAPFSYRLGYECRGKQIIVQATKNQFPQFWSRSDDQTEYEELSRRAYMAEDEDGRPLYRPSYVFGYYSGPSDRLASLYERHRERYYSWIIRSAEQRRNSKVKDPNSLRRLFYVQTLYGQFALLAFFTEPPIGAGDDRAFLREELLIDDLDSVMFVLVQPTWNRRGGDPRFWHADGEVREFLDRVYSEALLPVRMPRNNAPEVGRRVTSIDSLYLFLPDAKSLQAVYGSYRDQYAFFTALESTHLSRMLGEVRTRVKMTPAAGGGEVTYRDLSEGEQQLLLVLGLLKFTARDETLFLLDEPDTHLNPAWSTRYLEFLDRFIRRRATCHIIMSSHDPLVFAGLERDQVRIFRRGDRGQVAVEVPDRDPRGMGVAAILTSDLFRLRTTLDPATQLELDQLRLLSVIPRRTPDEDAEMQRLMVDLRDRGYEQGSRDPIYELFLQAWTGVEDPAWRTAIQLTPEQRKARAELASKIVEDLREEDPEG